MFPGEEYVYLCGCIYRKFSRRRRGDEFLHRRKNGPHVATVDEVKACDVNFPIPVVSKHVVVQLALFMLTINQIFRRHMLPKEDKSESALDQGDISRVGLVWYSIPTIMTHLQINPPEGLQTNDV